MENPLNESLLADPRAGFRQVVQHLPVRRLSMCRIGLLRRGPGIGKRDGSDRHVISGPSAVRDPRKMVVSARHLTLTIDDVLIASYPDRYGARLSSLRVPYFDPATFRSPYEKFRRWCRHALAASFHGTTRSSSVFVTSDRRWAPSGVTATTSFIWMPKSGPYTKGSTPRIMPSSSTHSPTRPR